MKLYATHENLKIFLTDNKDRRFYCYLGPFFCNPAVIKELEGPVYDGPDYKWLVARDGLKIVAFSSCRNAGKGIWWFNQTWVDPQYRRRGIYRHLFALKESLCAQSGASVLKGTALTISKQLFEEHGWTVTSHRGPRWTWYKKNLEKK